MRDLSTVIARNFMNISQIKSGLILNVVYPICRRKNRFYLFWKAVGGTLVLGEVLSGFYQNEIFRKFCRREMSLGEIFRGVRSREKVSLCQEKAQKMAICPSFRGF